MDERDAAWVLNAHTDLHNPLTPEHSRAPTREARADQPSGVIREGFPEEVPTMRKDEAFVQEARQGQGSTVCAKASSGLKSKCDQMVRR